MLSPIQLSVAKQASQKLAHNNSNNFKHLLTKLDANQEKEFQKQLRMHNKVDSDDYDYRGWYSKYGSVLPIDPRTGKLTTNGHYNDEFKLPNHPTFSTHSRFANGIYKDIYGDMAGEWTGNDKDGWTFKAGRRQYYSPYALAEYFRKFEPDAKLIDDRWYYMPDAEFIESMNNAIFYDKNNWNKPYTREGY